VNVLCSVRAVTGGIRILLCGELIVGQDKTGTLTQNKMHVEDAAIYDATFSVSSLRERLQSASPSVAENLRQLPTVSVICNAASFEGSPSDSRRNIIGDATGENCAPLSREKKCNRFASSIQPDSAILKFGDDIASSDAVRARWRHVHKVPFNSKVNNHPCRKPVCYTQS
jgi:sodium/potassium-transporting ATPase subunit alpha